MPAQDRRNGRGLAALPIDWDAQAFSQLRPGIFGATVVSDDLTVSLYRYAAGSA